MFTKYAHCTSELFLAIVVAFGGDYGVNRVGASTSTGVGGYVQTENRNYRQKRVIAHGFSRKFF